LVPEELAKEMLAKGFGFALVSLLVIFLVFDKDDGLGGKADAEGLPLLEAADVPPEGLSSFPLLFPAVIADPTGLGADADKGGYAPPEEDDAVPLDTTGLLLLFPSVVCSSLLLLVERPTTGLGADADNITGG